MIEVLASSGLVLLLDQASKTVVRRRLTDWRPSCGRLVRIRPVAHPSRLSQGSGARLGLVLVWTAAFVSGLVLHCCSGWFESHVFLIGLGSALGGAAGNLLDVLRRRPIVDFIDVGWWPVFNVADIGIVVGLIVALSPGI